MADFGETGGAAVGQKFRSYYWEEAAWEAGSEKYNLVTN